MKQDFLKRLQLDGYTPETLLDVGAHLGSFARNFTEVFPDCVPTLIEPNPFCQEQLAQLGYERHPVAASDTTGTAELFLTKEWLQSTGSSLYRENTAFFRDEVVVKREVQKARIDDIFCGRKFDFVKIDTQGSELDVLRGGHMVLRQADYILIEISLVEYNIGGARAEEVFQQLDAMGFRCAEIVEFHRLGGVHNGNLLQIDILFENRALSRAAHAPIKAATLDGLKTLARSLESEGRPEEVALLLEHLSIVAPRDEETLRRLIRLLAGRGRTLEALNTLLKLKSVAADAHILIEDIRPQMQPAMNRFNAHVTAGEIAEAEKYASALASLVPGNVALLNSAFSCNVALQRRQEAERYARALLALEPNHPGARAFLTNAPQPVAAPQTTDDRVAAALSAGSEVHPLIRLRDFHDAISHILCTRLTDEGATQIERLQQAAQALKSDVPAGSEWAGWEKHYRLALKAIDMPGIFAPTPEEQPEPKLELASSSGKPLDWNAVQSKAKKLGAKVVFFAAADRNYVNLYARWYVKSVLKYCDVGCLVVVHVIGGAGHLRDVAKSLGIGDERVVFCGDDFDAASVRTKCFDTPPKGLIEKPVAHFQSVRFQRLGALLKKLRLPVFVSDIDLLLQRGVVELMQRCEGADIVLNENESSPHAGSRFTANLILARPTDNAQVFFRFLRSYLDKALSGSEVSRWIDQFGLLMAQHHLVKRGAYPRIGRFDTTKDINNVMYKSYQDNPFTFLSLYHGFDTSTLEDKPQVAGDVAAQSVARSTKKQRKNVAAGG